MTAFGAWLGAAKDAPDVRAALHALDAHTAFVREPDGMWLWESEAAGLDVAVNTTGLIMEVFAVLSGAAACYRGPLPAALGPTPPTRASLRAALGPPRAAQPTYDEWERGPNTRPWRFVADYAGDGAADGEHSAECDPHAAVRTLTWTTPPGR